MKRLYIVFAIVLLGSLVFAGSASAQASGPPTEDAWVDGSTVSNNTTTFILQGSGNPDSSCAVISYGYMKFNLSGLNRQVGYAELDMRLTGTTAAGTATTITLYAVADDPWTETTVGNTKPQFGGVLTSATVSSSTTVPSWVTFPTSDAFVKYFNDEGAFDPAGSNDNIASIGIRISACSTSATVRFGTSENAGNEPQLHLRTAVPPNAVEVSKAIAQPVSWTLYAGLGAVALVVVAGVVVTRRRTA